MKNTYYIIAILFLTTSLFINCSKEEENNTTNKKYFLTKDIFDDGSYNQYIYNQDDNVSKRIYLEKGGFTVYTEYIYDSNNLLNEINYYADSILNTRTIVAMNANNTVNQASMYMIDFDTFTYTFEYDSKQQLTKINYYQGELVIAEKLRSYVVFNYNTQGDVIEEWNYDYNNNLNAKYIYEYDTKLSPSYLHNLKWTFLLSSLYLSENVGDVLSYNNLVKQTQTIPEPTMTRSFTYYYNDDGYPTRASNGFSVITFQYLLK
jgi:hypothetical protein